MKYLDLAIANEQIKTMEIKGNDYALVNQRIKAFRMVYPQGQIRTEMLSNENGVCIFRAMVFDDKVALLGTGHAYEKEDSSFINKTSYIENCETSAVGRALGMAGFGIDVSVASAEEMQNAIQNQQPTQEEANEYKLTFGKYKDKLLKDVYKEDENYVQWLLGNTNDERMIKIIQLATGIEIPSENEEKERLHLLTEINDLINEKEVDIKTIRNRYNIKSLNQLTTAKLIEVKNILKKMGCE